MIWSLESYFEGMMDEQSCGSVRSVGNRSILGGEPAAICVSRKNGGIRKYYSPLKGLESTKMSTAKQEPTPRKKLSHLRPEQYESWLRKIDDPDWVHHRYRDAKDNAMANAVRDLRDVISQNNDLLKTLKLVNRVLYPGNRTMDDMMRDMGYACDRCRYAIGKAEGGTK